MNPMQSIDVGKLTTSGLATAELPSQLQGETGFTCVVQTELYAGITE